LAGVARLSGRVALARAILGHPRKDLVKVEDWRRRDVLPWEGNREPAERGFRFAAYPSEQADESCPSASAKQRSLMKPPSLAPLTCCAVSLTVWAVPISRSPAIAALLSQSRSAQSRYRSPSTLRVNPCNRAERRVTA